MLSGIAFGKLHGIRKIFGFFFFMARQPLVVNNLLIGEASQSHSKPKTHTHSHTHTLARTPLDD